MNRKGITAFCLALATAAAFMVGCGKDPGIKTEELSFDGTILEIGDTSLVVAPNDDSWARRSSDRISVSISNAELQDENGNALTADALYLDGAVVVFITDEIAESYPAQATATKVIFDTQSPHRGTTSVVNPMVELPSADFMDITGFALGGLPDRDDLRAEKYFGYLLSDQLEDNIAEVYLCGTASDEINFRVALDQGTDISGIYEEFSSTETVQVGEVAVTLKASDNNVLATWSNYDYAFSVYLMNCSQENALPVIEELVTNVMIAMP